MIKKIKKHRFVFDLLKFLYFLAITTYYYLFLLIFSVFRINKDKIIIINFGGRGFGDSGKYLSMELLKYGYEIYWAANIKFKNTLPKEINYVKFNSVKYLYHLATAKIWINNSRFNYGIRKRKKQFYIQTWHGCFALKKVESAVEDTLSKYYIWGAKNDSKMANLFISNSEFCTNFYRKYFRYNGEILECGCPRNDIIVDYNKDIVEKVRKYFGFVSSEKMCLYTPTFRADGSLNAYDLDYEVLLKELKNKFNGNRKLLIRLHPNISHLSNKILGFNRNVIDATNYTDIQELLVTADFLLTDYSSCIFDYAISKKPAIIYASDVEEYKKDRDFEIRLEEIPFPIATNNDEVKEVINNYDICLYKNKLNKFYLDMGLKETGKSCKKIVETINEIVKNKERNRD